MIDLSVISSDLLDGLRYDICIKLPLWFQKVFYLFLSVAPIYFVLYLTKILLLKICILCILC